MELGNCLNLYNDKRKFDEVRVLFYWFCEINFVFFLVRIECCFGRKWKIFIIKFYFYFFEVLYEYD